MLVSCLLLAHRAAGIQLAAPPDLPTQLAASINVHRQGKGLTTLARNENLDKAAQAMADDIARTGNLAHQDSQGRQLRARVEAAGYQGWRRITENLAMGSTTSDQTVSLWEGSRGHREAMVRTDITEQGVGVAPSPEGPVWVWIGGRR